jgi:hypothetical protein
VKENDMDEHEFDPAFVGGAAPQHKPRMSVDAEASLMNRGTMRNLSYLVAGALLVIGVGGLLLQKLGRADAYAQAEASTESIGRDHFAGFFNCALPGTHSSQLNAQRVQTGLERLGDRDGKRYGQVLAKCLPQMHALTASVQALETPALVKTERAALAGAATELAAANTNYLSYLSDRTTGYERSTAMPLQKRFGAAWAGYLDAEHKLVAAMEQSR